MEIKRHQMNPLFRIIVFATILSFSMSCKKSTEEFTIANGQVAEQFVKRIDIFSSIPSENKSYTINYDGAGRVSSITDGSQSRFFNYASSGSLDKISDGDDALIINNLFQTPYCAFEIGDVLEYDNVGNPKRILVYEDGYGSQILTGEIIYDAAPNPFFYTLRAAGLLDVLDRVDLNMRYQSPVIIKARLLLPLNNIIGGIFKNEQGITKYEVHATYQYSSARYPISATIDIITPDDVKVYTVNYYFK
jgi:hypothetical protein